ncbi:rhodanese-like domain-containing protein [Paenibacillus whitsoniae]|uniref:Rhodanese-like domain-containing protein n=1 Tax=Paenibacillus whitsoniae TaxID=2496558 RepID=A0A430JFN0_9BACL|nr:rhodanese-like domain-containing protein [Paenibacillus whitsoniae]RTE09828.1 rhodanese-like domain-containing protein [Paenibacillus whitsoniae]
MYTDILPQDVLRRQEQGEPVHILDVREQDEWESGHIHGAYHIPLGQINRALNELDREQETIVVCRSGNRSSRACEYLSSLGCRVVNMTGGMSAWSGALAYGQEGNQGGVGR